MTAIFGYLGVHDGSVPRGMGDVLAHRGSEHAALDLPGGGFVGARGTTPGDRVRRVGSITLATHATMYDAPGPPSEYTARLAALVQAGPQSFDRLDADFALIAVHDDGTVTLARDFFGCAPLYFAQTPGGLAFATEYKALLEVPGFAPTADPDMLQHLQHGKRLPLGKTLLRGVEAVLPGTVLTIAPDGSRAVHRMPALIATGELGDENAASELIRVSLVRALTRRTADLSTIGLALSGGIDSIALAFMIHELWPDKRLVTVCAGSSPEDQECVTARAVAEAVGSEHHEVITPPGDLSVERMRELAWHLEDPYSRSEALQLAEVGRQAALAGCTVVLSAQGADGLFAGMPKYKLLRLMERYAPLRGSLAEFWSYTQLGTEPRSPVARLGVLAKFRGAVPPVPRVRGSDYTPPQATFPPPGPQFINRSMSRGFQAGVCQDIQKFERGFAAHGVEYRSPFYDPQFVHDAYSIDDELKLKNGQEKWIFRRALSAWVPAEFLDIPKFPQRIDAGRDLADALDRLMFKTTPPRGGDDLFELDSLDRMILRTRGKPYVYEAAMRLWTAVLSRLWAEQFVRSDVPDRVEETQHG
ncbi:MAG: asparagine synthase (glutamine-hydrolyzing) [Phycisphaerales bacterium]|jgi:asparagine synthase (glutamine-hydrolysing)